MEGNAFTLAFSIYIIYITITKYNKKIIVSATAANPRTIIMVCRFINASPIRRRAGTSVCIRAGSEQQKPESPGPVRRAGAPVRIPRPSDLLRAARSQEQQSRAGEK